MIFTGAGSSERSVGWLSDGQCKKNALAGSENRFTLRLRLSVLSLAWLPRSFNFPQEHSN
jgi:hypothetical protein